MHKTLGLELLIKDLEASIRNMERVLSSVDILSTISQGANLKLKITSEINSVKAELNKCLQIKSGLLPDTTTVNYDFNSELFNLASIATQDLTSSLL